MKDMLLEVSTIVFPAALVYSFPTGTTYVYIPEKEAAEGRRIEVAGGCQEI